MTRGEQPRHGLGDPRIPWVVLLEVETASVPDARAVAGSLAALAVTAGWPVPDAGAVVTGDRRSLLTSLSSDGSRVVRVGLHDSGLVLAARHDALDGLAMLTAAGRLLGVGLRSSARGVGSRRRLEGAAPLVGRAWEVLARPPGRVAPSGTFGTDGDSFAQVVVAGSPRTADLVHASVQAVLGWNEAHHTSRRSVSVAVGVSTVGGASPELADRSAYLRLTGVERLGIDDVRQRLADAPLQPGGGGETGSSVLGRAARIGVRVLAPRLGSTLLVSHLGAVEAPPDVDTIAFYPVAGGGSGLSLGAATVRGRTTLTLRGRRAQHDDEGQRQLLALVVEALGLSPVQ